MGGRERGRGRGRERERERERGREGERERENFILSPFYTDTPPKLHFKTHILPTALHKQETKFKVYTSCFGAFERTKSSDNMNLNSGQKAAPVSRWVKAKQ